MNEDLRKQTSYMIAPDTLRLIVDRRERFGLNNAEFLAEGIKLLAQTPELILETPKQPYGSGKKAKVFNLPLDAYHLINELAEQHDMPKTHVVDVAIRHLASNPPNEAADKKRASSRFLLEMAKDEDLLAELHRRGLLSKGFKKA